MAKKYNSELNFKLQANAADFRSELQKANNTFRSFAKGAAGIAGTLGVAFGVSELVSFGKELVNTRAEFQKFEAVLSNTLGSESAAQKALKQINDFVSKTPFQVDEVTGSFVKLANQGFKPSVDQLRQLGDLAASTGKSFDQLAEAIIDAQVGEFERLKEFGIRASKQGDQVKFTFKGVETQVKFTADSIKEYITGLGDAEGVSGAMEKISQTLGGQLSNLEDNFTNLRNELGKLVDNEGAGFLSWLNNVFGTINKSLAKRNDPFSGLVVSSEDLGEMEKNITLLQKKRADLEKAIEMGRGATNIGGIDPVKELEKVNKALTEQIRLLNEVAQTSAEKDLGGEAEEAVPLIQALEKQLKELTEARDNAFSVDAIAAFNRKIEETSEQLKRLKSITITTRPEGISSVSSTGATELESDTGTPVPLRDANALKAYTEQQVEITKSFKYITDEARAMSEAVSSSFTSMAINGIDAFAGLVAGLNEPGKAFRNFGKAIFATLGQVATQLGKTAIAIGLAVEGIKKAISTLNPAAAIIGGAALLVLGASIKNGLNVPSLDVGTNYVQKSGLAKIHEGEAIVPKKFNPAAFGGGGTKVKVGEFRMEGRTIVAALEAESDYRNKVF